MKVESLEIIMGWLKDFLLWDEAALAFHLQRPDISHRSVCIPVAAEHCNAPAVQPQKKKKVCVDVVVVVEPWFCMPHQHKRPTSAGNEPELMACLALSIVTHSCLMPSAFHLLNTILHSQWFRIRGETTGTGEQKKNDYWVKIPSIRLSGIARAPRWTQRRQ